MTKARLFLKSVLFAFVVKAVWTDCKSTVGGIIHFIEHSATISGVSNIRIGETAQFNCSNKCGANSYFVLSGNVLEPGKYKIGENVTLNSNFQIFLEKLEFIRHTVHCINSLVNNDVDVQTVELSIIPYTAGTLYVQCYTALVGADQDNCWPGGLQAFVYGQGKIVNVYNVDRNNTDPNKNSCNLASPSSSTHTPSAIISLSQPVFCPTPSFIGSTVTVTEYSSISETYTPTSCNTTRRDVLPAVNYNPHESGKLRTVCISLAVGLPFITVITITITIIFCYVLAKKGNCRKTKSSSGNQKEQRKENVYSDVSLHVKN